jgi:hypothetical protein
VTWVGRLALGAVIGLLLAFLIGTRRRLGVVRAAGFWAIGAGLAWMVLPRAAEWAARQWLPGHAALVRAVLRGATGPVAAAATTLVMAGVAAVVASFVVARLPSLRRLGGPGGAGTQDDAQDAHGTDSRPWARRRFGAGAPVSRPGRRGRGAPPSGERQPVDAYL